MHDRFNFSSETIDLIKRAEKDLKDIYSNIDEVCDYNSFKVLNAFKKNKLSEMHFNSTTGYGYNDIGRDTIEKIYADIQACPRKEIYHCLSCSQALPLSEQDAPYHIRALLSMRLYRHCICMICIY